MNSYEFWFVVGSQFLYGQEVLDTVEARGREMAADLSRDLPYPLVFKTVVKTPEDADNIMREASHSAACAGVITWCHTFSPSKMWAAGLQALQKPWCHLATQYNREIPDREIDMDFMNLNQAAHGDREHGFIGARLRRQRGIAVGYWRDAPVRRELGDWMRAAAAAAFSRSLRIVRFGDNMRQVAVTEGDKVEALLKFGWHIDYWPVGSLCEEMEAVGDPEIREKLDEYRARYDFATDDLETVAYQAREELAIRRVMAREQAHGFVNTFQDLYGMRQLPGLASQNIMADGYGYGAEGDWKLSALTAVVKAMGEGLPGGTSFIEDYTYDLTPGKETALGAHMLEVCPSIAAGRPRIEVHPLGIGDREPPARLVFEGAPGSAVVVTLVDMGGRMRMIAQDVECIRPICEMPNLPVARVMWKGAPDLYTGVKCWILAGGAHHSVLSTQATPAMLESWAETTDIEFVHITKNTDFASLKDKLFLSDLVWKLR